MTLTVPPGRPPIPIEAKDSGGFQALGLGSSPAPITEVTAWYKPSVLQFISWDAPTTAHTGIDIDYKMTAYDWENRSLNWSVTGPAGMTIDTDGTLHWTPSTDLTSETVTVDCSLGGQQTLSKTFTINVDNSKCCFVSPTGSDTAAGTVAAPFATYSRAFAYHDARGDANGGIIYFRGGDYTLTDMTWDDMPSKFDANSAWLGGESNPFLMRNYPTEEPLFTIASGSGLRTNSSYMVFHGLTQRGVDTTSGGGGLLRRSVMKRVKSYDFQSDASVNPHGFSTAPGTILDQCVGWDNYDRAAPTFFNNANFLYYADKSPEFGDGFVIDCLSDSLGTKTSGCGFKIKHSGGGPVHFHKCVDTGSVLPFAGLQNQATVRYSTFYTDRDQYVAYYGITDAGNNDKGMLTQHCTLFSVNSASSARPIRYNQFSDGPYSDQPPLWFDNLIVVEDNTSNYNVLSWNHTASALTPQFVFNNNQLYVPSPQNAVLLEAPDGAQPITTIAPESDGNTYLASAPDLTFSAAGRNFQIVSGVCSEII